MHKRLPSKGLSPLERRVPKSDKYSHVTGKLDTGLTVDKVKFVTAREFSKRRDEIFFRINRNNLYELFIEYEANEYESMSDSFRGGDESLKIVTYNESSNSIYEKPYLILDVRDTEAFNNCHILQARSFPYTMLRRDHLHPDVYKFKNKPETLIILYCNDEKISADAAKVMVDRGIDNVFVLNGGLHEFAADYPAFVEGIPPSPPKSKTTNTTGKSSTTRLAKIPEDKAYMPSNPNELTPRKLLKHNTLLSDSPKSKSSYRNDNRSDAGMSSSSNMSVAESVISRAMSRKGKF